MSYVLTNGGGRVERYPYPLSDLARDRPELPAEPTDEELAAIGVYPVTPVAAPAASVTRMVSALPPAEVDGVWTEQWDARDIPLAEAKEALRAAINAKRDAVFAAGFTPASGPLAGKTLQTRGIEDRTNWLTSQAAYSAAVAAGGGALQEAYFRTADNETVNCTYLEGLQTLLAMAAWGKAVMGASWALKDALEAAQDLDGFDINEGWPA